MADFHRTAVTGLTHADGAVPRVLQETVTICHYADLATSRVPKDSPQDVAWVFGDLIWAVTYGVVLMYFFLGVSIISDIFMGAIEVITSRKKQKLLPTGQVITLEIWNATVANLSLMALGSSAPEILLAVTEIIGNGMYAGELGPATIVGSASFNLFVIIALCIFVIPSTETRSVEEMPVFFITAFFMFVAYGWLALIVSTITPDVIDIWEAVVTLVFLPVLIYISYLADIGKFGDFGKAMEVRQEDVNSICQLLCDFERPTIDAIRAGIAKRPDLLDLLEAPTAADIERFRDIVKKNIKAKKSRAVRRMEATRAATGSKKIKWQTDPALENTLRIVGLTGASIQDVPLALPKGTGPCIVQFATEAQVMSVTSVVKMVMVTRSGDCSKALTVSYGVMITVNARREQRASKMSKPDSQDGSSFGDYTSGSTSQHSLSAAGSSFHSLPGSQMSLNVVPKLFRSNSLSSSHSSSSTPMGYGSAQSNIRRTGAQSNAACLSQCYETGVVNFAEGEDVAHIEVACPTGVSVDGRTNQFTISLFTNSQGTGDLGDQSRQTTPSELDRSGSFHSKDTEFHLGTIAKTLVVIRPGGMQGKLVLPYHQLLIQGSQEKQIMQILVQRRTSTEGEATCNYRTERLTSVPGVDYVHSEGQIRFECGETERIVELEILPKKPTAAQDDFILVLEDPSNLELDANTDGGAEQEILTIEIGPTNLKVTQFGDKMLRWLDQGINLDELRLGHEEYKEQFTSAIYCNGSYEDQLEASRMDIIFHIVALPWKLVFVFVPPTTYCGGWICFWTALGFVGLLTYFIGGCAEVFGCALGIPDLMTAILFVALGTSMPDLFASKIAATQDDTADAAIVNVTGSNCVNVFLGLGLPWTVASIYWRVVEWDPEWASKYPAIADSLRADGSMKFVVLSGDLTFSVGIFFVCAVMALKILVTRRIKIGAELGGPFLFKITSSVAMVCLWIAYIAISSWWSLRRNESSHSEKILVAVAGGLLILLPFFVFLFIAATFKMKRASMIVEMSQEEIQAQADAQAAKESHVLAINAAAAKQGFTRRASYRLSQRKSQCSADSGEDGKVSLSKSNSSVDFSPGGSSHTTRDREPRHSVVTLSLDNEDGEPDSSTKGSATGSKEENQPTELQVVAECLTKISEKDVPPKEDKNMFTWCCVAAGSGDSITLEP